MPLVDVRDVNPSELRFLSR